MKSSHQLTLLHRLFCLLMALQVINFSVDPPDRCTRMSYYGNDDEDLTINEIESIGEWILEIGLDYPDSFPEHDENDDDGKLSKPFSCWVSPELFVLVLPSSLINFVYQPRIHFLPMQYVHYFGEVASPPPWQSKLLRG